MSSGLYRVRVLGMEAAGRRVRLRVFLFRCDEGWDQDLLPPEDPSFFFRVLWEAADGIGARRRGPDEARAAYLVVHEVGEPGLLAEARQRAGMETPAERGCHLARAGDRAAAEEELRRAYEPHSVPVEFGLALYAGDFGAAEAALERIGGDLEENHAGCVAADLAFLHAREGDDAAVEAVVELLSRIEFALGAWHYALGNGSAHPLEAVVTVGRRLTPLLPPSDSEAHCLQPLRSEPACVPGRFEPGPRVAAAVSRMRDGTGTPHDLGLAEGELLRLRGTGRGTDGDPYAALLYAQWLAATGGGQPARELWLKISEQGGRGAARGGGRPRETGAGCRRRGSRT